MSRTMLGMVNVIPCSASLCVIILALLPYSWLRFICRKEAELDTKNRPIADRKEKHSFAFYLRT